ncbi:Protein-S-isoprenylcysteine O-methyltransferase Ste14 [Rhizobiales bacterium GAS191]|nr:Protein-S-isoprenylcysteine O-methyltransferase Ste14 [Rhizobiales bacterium GAS191]
MSRLAPALIGALWAGFALYWIIAALNVKATLRRESLAQRLMHVVPLFICAALFLPLKLLLTFLPQALSFRFLPHSGLVEAAGLALLVAGLAFAVWARWHLGRNWSGAIALKSDHTLIRSGPYGLVRHPIYTGLLLALLGSAIALGEWRGLLGLAFASGAILLRVGAEDALMAQTFGDAYRDYRRRTKALIPFLL